MFPFSATQELSRLTSFQPAIRNMYFFCFSDLNGWNISFFSVFYLLPDILVWFFFFFFFWESELIYHQGRKKVIPYLPVSKLPLAEKIQQNSLVLWINVLLALTNPRSMDSHCSLQVGLIFSLWFLFPWSKEILGSFFDPAFEECACLLWVCFVSWFD